MKAHRGTKLGLLFVTAVSLFAMSTPTTAASASTVDVPDQVLAWNQHAIDELIGTQGAGAMQYLAPVHGAMYDAVNAIAGGYQPYLVAPPAEPTYSENAAAATAAYQVL